MRSTSRWRLLGRTTLAVSLLGALGVTAAASSASAELTGVTFASVTAGLNNTCAISTAGALYCWGSDSFGQLEDGNTTPSDVPVLLNLSSTLGSSTVAQVATGDGTICVLPSGTATTVWCWGHGSLGELGDNSRSNTPIPQQVAFSGGLTGNVKQLVGGSSDTFCALTTTSQIWCWGSNNAGSLGSGTGTTGNSDVPEQVVNSGVLAGQTVISLAGGYQVFCVVGNNSAAYCWGNDVNGALGNNNTGLFNTPVQVSTSGMPSGSAFKSISPSDTHTCARVSVSSAIEVWCWGENLDGALGTGDTNDGTEPGGAIDDPSTPQNVTALNSSGVTAVSSSPSESCGLTSAKVLECWGEDPLGDGNPEGAVDSPEAIAHGDLYSRSLTSLTTNQYVTCVVDSQGSLYCWGVNSVGQIGDGTTTTSTSPEQIAESPTSTPIDTVPNTPRTVAGTAGDASIDVSWQVPYDNGGQTITQYNAEAVNIATSTVDGTCQTDAATFSCTIDTLVNGDYYDVYVSAKNSNGNSLESGASNNPLEPTSVPGPPTDVGAQGANDVANVSWAEPTDDGGLPISGYTATAFIGTSVEGSCDTEGASDTACTIDSLTNGLTYEVSVTAANANGNSPASTPQAPVIVGEPDPPASANAQPGNQQISVTWTASPNEGGAPITEYVATAKVGQSTEDCNTGPSGTSCTILNLTNGTTYDVSVTALNSIGPSGPTDAGNVTPVTYPDAPTLDTAVGGDSSIAVTWTAAGDDGGSPVSGFTATAEDSSFNTSQCAGGATDTGCTITALTNGTAYTVTVTETTGFGTSGNSNTISATAASVPGAPTLDSATASDQQIAVTWTDNGADGGSAVTGYIASATVGNAATTCSTDENGTGCTITGLTNGTTYSVTVVESNAKGNSLPSNSMSAKPVTNPDAPTLANLASGSGSLTATWSAGSDDGGDAVTGFTATATASSSSFHCNAGGSATSCMITGLTNGTTYSVSVTETTDFATSTSSNTLSDSVGTVTTAPLALKITLGNETITGSWTAPSNDGGFAVQHYTFTASPGGEMCTTSALGCEITGLNSDVDYSVSVVAINAKGTSPAATVSGLFAYVPTHFSLNTGGLVQVPGTTFYAVVGGLAPKAKVTFSLKGGASSTCVVDVYRQCSWKLKFNPSINHLSAKAGSQTLLATIYVVGISAPSSVHHGSKLDVKFVDGPPVTYAQVSLSDGRTFKEKLGTNGDIGIQILMPTAGTETLTFTVDGIVVPPSKKVTVT